MLLESKVNEISDKFQESQKDGEYGFSITLLAALLSIVASLYSLWKNCHEDDASYGAFRMAAIKRREDRLVKRVINEHLPDLDEEQLEKLKNIILDVVKNTTEEEYAELTKELARIK